MADCGIKKKHQRSAEAVMRAFNGCKGDTLDLFVYGTLMSDKHVQLLLNRHVDADPCTLNNYMKIIPPGAFFFIVKQRGAQVKGRLLKDLTQEEMARLDEFEDEGNLYFKKPVVVRGLDGMRRRCLTYVGNVPMLQHRFAREILFEDRYSQYVERKIDQILAAEAEKSGLSSTPLPPDQAELQRQSLRELMGSEIDSLIESHFDGDYVCNYIMSQAFSDARPPDLAPLLKNQAISPYADNYMFFACKHIIFNQIVDRVRSDFHDAVRVAQRYYRHGTAILLAFMYYNSNKVAIERMMSASGLDKAVPGRLYREYAALCIRLVEEVYDRKKMADIVDYVESNWHSTKTPLGAELEFSPLGARAVYAEPGEEPLFDGFYWFNDFDLQRRTWRLGGHVDAHRIIMAGGHSRNRGFFEYALGRFNIGADLSRPLLDCPWAMSMIINEAVKFLGIPPHSLHISMQLETVHGHTVITDHPHKDSDLVCLLLLGGDLRHDDNGVLREWRIHNNELDTNSMHSLNFSDRKHHFCRANDEGSGSDVMEYKFLRLHAERTDYSRAIIALKNYQIETRARPITIMNPGQSELPEQHFIREWAAHPQSLSRQEINDFVGKVEQGMQKEHNTISLDKRDRKVLENIYTELVEKNDYVEEG